MVVILKQYLRFHNQVSKALLDFPGPQDLCRRESNIIEDIVECLEPVKCGVEALCRHDSDLYQAETIFKLILNQLKDRGAHFALELKCQIEKIFFERRH